MSYIPHTEEDRAAMLAEIGVQGVDDLFRDIPEEVRYPQLDLMRPLSEMEALRRLQALSESNVDTVHFINFLGAGAYDHFVPSVVKHVTSRSEFYTAYTPYQPEISQGTLQSIFEYQSMICDLTGMDVANASHYDGATSLAEAVLMAYYIGRQKRTKVVLAPTLHPEYRATVQTYLQGLGCRTSRRGGHGLAAPASGPGRVGRVDRWPVLPAWWSKTPTFSVSSMAAWMSWRRRRTRRALCSIVSADPISLGLLCPPGSLWGGYRRGRGTAARPGPAISAGPTWAISPAGKEHVHKMAGPRRRRDGGRGRQARLCADPHRARAAYPPRARHLQHLHESGALRAGGLGLSWRPWGRADCAQIAELCYHKAHYAASQIAELPGFSMVGSAPSLKSLWSAAPSRPAMINDASAGARHHRWLRPGP